MIPPPQNPGQDFRRRRFLSGEGDFGYALREGRKSPNIHVGSGVIRGIPADGCNLRGLWRRGGTMTKAVRQISAFLWGSLGHCSVCIRKAFLAAAVAWSLTGLIAVSGFSPVLLPAVVGAVGLTLLWVAHLLVFARRFSRGKTKPDPAIQSANAVVECAGANLRRTRVCGAASGQCAIVAVALSTAAVKPADAVVDTFMIHMGPVRCAPVLGLGFGTPTTADECYTTEGGICSDALSPTRAMFGATGTCARLFLL